MTGTDATPGGPSAGSRPRIRPLRATDVEELAEILRRARAHISGSRSPAIFRAVLADSLGPQPRTAVLVAEDDEVLVGAIVVLLGDVPRYYRTLPLRHPIAAGALLVHRGRKLPARLRFRAKARAAEPPGAAPHPVAAPELAEDPRLHRPPLGPGEAGPRPTDHGPSIASTIWLHVDRYQRRRGIGTSLLQAAAPHLRALGTTRLDCNFDPADPAAARLYLGMHFEVFRFPAGYFASLDLGPGAGEAER